MVVSLFLCAFISLSLIFSYVPTRGSVSWVLSLFGTCLYGPLLVMQGLSVILFPHPTAFFVFIALLAHIVVAWWPYRAETSFSSLISVLRVPRFWTRPDERWRIASGEADLYKARRVDAPCVLVIFGGAFVRGESAQLVHLLFSLRNKGYHVVALPYRTLPQGIWPKGLEDLVIGAKHVMSLKRHDFRPQEFHVMGRSAGGFLSLMLAHSLKDEDRIKSVTAFYPICDLKSWAQEPGAQQILQADDVVSRLLQNYSRDTLDLRDYPQNQKRRYFICTGDFDRFVEPRHSAWISQFLRGQGCSVKTRVYTRQNHVFDVNQFSFAGQALWKDLTETLEGGANWAPD